MRKYKQLLKEGDKDRLYFFKGMVYAAINHDNTQGWRCANDFLEEVCNSHFMFETYYALHKDREKNDKNSSSLFGMTINDCIKRTA